jgi:hypothetical protein
VRASYLFQSCQAKTGPRTPRVARRTRHTTRLTLAARPTENPRKCVFPPMHRLPCRRPRVCVCACACACACVRDRARFLPIDMYSHSTARTLTLVCAVDTCTSIHRWHSTTCTKGPPHHTRTHRHSLPLTATHYPYRHRRCDCDHRSPMFARSPHTNKDGKGKHELGFNPKAFSVQRPQKIRKRFQHKQVRAHCVIHSLS